MKFTEQSERCIRERDIMGLLDKAGAGSSPKDKPVAKAKAVAKAKPVAKACLLYTSDAADE